MKKTELIYRDILTRFFGEKQVESRQIDLAARLRCSVSTVFHALEVPRRIGAVRVAGRNFALTDAEKLLTFWATRRSLGRDILYQTYSADPVRVREGNMPPEIIFGAYSAYRFQYGEAPADYDRVYVYAASAARVRARFPRQKGLPNVTVINADSRLASFGKLTPPAQTFVDLWNLPDWYARDFRQALRAKLFPQEA